ncbi:MAG: hypothetical protein ABEJ24_01735 [Candidatus Magasanikbacteria bacterium]
MADVLVSLLELSNVYEIDLEEELKQKIKDIEPRAEEWVENLGKTLQSKRDKLD